MTTEYDTYWNYIDELDASFLESMGNLSLAVAELDELVNNPRISSDAFEDAKEIAKKDLYKMDKEPVSIDNLQHKILYLYIDDLTTNILQRLKSAHRIASTGATFLRKN
jgi:hypothetical protein